MEFIQLNADDFMDVDWVIFTLLLLLVENILLSIKVDIKSRIVLDVSGLLVHSLSFGYLCCIPYEHLI